MLHRYSHTLPWSVSKLGKPSDLPDVLREDLLLLIPVDPYKIFAAWNVSYQTQNTVSKLLGESVFSVSRLVIHIEGAYQDTSSLSPTVPATCRLKRNWHRAIITCACAAS